MQIDYIAFSKKNDASLSKESEIVDILRTCFDNVKGDSFEVTYKRRSYTIEYLLTKHLMEQGEDYVFNLSFLLTLPKKQQTVRVIETCHNLFMQSKEAKKHHIAISYDEISAYYSGRAYPLFHEFESQLRNLVFKLLINTFGALWLDKTISDEMKTQLKEKVRDRNKGVRNEKLIEQALHEMDIYQLEQFLFAEKRDIDPSQLVDVHLSVDSVQNMSKEQIVAALESSRPASLWDKYFAPKIEIPDLRNKITQIRKYRNKVAHCKPFHLDDYNHTVKILKDDGLIQQIKNAANISVEDISTLSMRDVMVGLVDIGTKTAAFAGKAIEFAFPALMHLAEIGLAARNALDVSGLGNALMQLANYQTDLMPAFEMQQQMSEIVNSPGMQAAMEAQEQFTAIANSPGIQAAMEAQEQFTAIANNPGMQAAMEAQEQIAAIANNPGMQAAMEAQEQFAAIANSPGMQAAMEAQEQIAAIANSPGMQAAIETQRHLQDLVGSRIPPSPLDKISNSALLRALEHQDRISRLINPTFVSFLDDTYIESHDNMQNDIQKNDVGDGTTNE